MTAGPLRRLLAAATGRPCHAHYDPAKPHHTPAGFRNTSGLPPPRSSDVLRWQWQRLRARRPRPPAAPIGSVAPANADLRAANSATWLGHATLLARLGDCTVLTDPQFGRYASPLPFAGPPRHQPPPVRLGDLPRVDVVALSHSHYDHLDRATVRALYRQPGEPPRFLAPLGVDDWLARHVCNGERDRIHALDWWQTTYIGALRATLLPVQHWSARTLWDRNATLWGAWALEAGGVRFFFAGDLGLSPDVDAIGAACGGFDLAALPIGAYAPRWIMQPYHLDPAEAVAVHQRIGARRSVAVHWGTFEGLTDEPLDEPPQRLVAARAAAGLAPEAFQVIRPGETVYAAGRDTAGA